MSEPHNISSALNQQLIYDAISPSARAVLEAVEVLQSIDSTNDRLLGQSISQGQGRICVTESQLAGRGRRGNDWQSAPHKNIMLSLSWGFSRWPETITGLGLAVALVAAERLNQDYQLGVKIKWPNDLLIDGDKLAGILIDVSGNAGDACNVVIGLGLNVHQPDWSDSDTGYRWCDLHSKGVVLDRNQFIGQLVTDWIGMLQGFELHGFAPLASVWNEHSSYTGMEITVGDGDDCIVGKMLGVDDVGALVVQAHDGSRHSFADSNVSVRVAAAR
ncbi:MAG: biotin--[acetyl-CoA-carboxylase] ligase [Pseudomonadota bacterium]